MFPHIFLYLNTWIPASSTLWRDHDIFKRYCAAGKGGFLTFPAQTLPASCLLSNVTQPLHTPTATERG